jgi:hypothetical protein
MATHSTVRDVIRGDELLATADMHSRYLTWLPQCRVPHELVGVRSPGKLLAREAGWPIAAHVPAERALVASGPEYSDKVSPFSINTLMVSTDG